VSTGLSQGGGRGGRAGRVPRAEARRRILEAAERVLAREGFGGLTVDAVMADAGLARTAFYRHFDGRGQLVAALLEALAAELGPEIAPAEDLEAVDDAGGLRELLDVGGALVRRHGALLRAAEEARHVDPDVRRAYDAFLEFLVQGSVALVRARAHVPGAATPPVGEDVVRALIDLNTRVMLEWDDGEAAREALYVIWSRTLGVEPNTGAGGSRGAVV
jgi:AcrR family transcriptional regulator